MQTIIGEGHLSYGVLLAIVLNILIWLCYSCETLVKRGTRLSSQTFVQPAPTFIELFMIALNNRISGALNVLF